VGVGRHPDDPVANTAMREYVLKGRGQSSASRAVLLGWVADENPTIWYLYTPQTTWR